MGIDVYLRWDGQTEAERSAQITGFSVRHGHVGYLREAYHGEPYAIRLLVPEAREGARVAKNEEDYERGTPIPAATLRERLPAVVKAAILRARAIYKEELDEGAAEVKAFADFVQLAEEKERETGKPCRVVYSG